MSRERSGTGIVALLALPLFAGACAPSSPQREPELVRLTAHEFELLMPDTLEDGLVHVRVVNDGTFWHHALFAKLDSTQTRDGYLAEIRAGADFPRGAIDMGGTPLLAPRDSSDTIMRFTPGRWVALCTSSGGGMWHVAAGMLTGFTVVERAGSPAPREPDADLTLVMHDDSYEFPDTIPAGVRWVRVENQGRKWHECDILRLEAGKTVADYRAWRKVEHLHPPRVATPVGGVADFIPGEILWTRVDFRPGRHLLICDMPGDSLHNRTIEVIAAQEHS